ncbi:MAG: sulfur oxidation c-type cytochrome SoxA, partial [Proteobacteria bacterium]|nr:sulfur oxidation c-type cytochrome SoxA [Pseudomonadota bacterium]
IGPFASAQSPSEHDMQIFRDFFSKQYPYIDLDEYKDGAYIFNEKAKEQWLEIEDFPPYEFDIEDGQVLFETPFANGQSYKDCFENGGLAIKQTYPKWDETEKTIITLEYDINRCREQNDEKPLKYGVGDLAQISAYMAYTSRGKIIDLPEPAGDAITSYEAGRKYYYSKRGQLNMACANCHLSFANVKLRYEIPGPILGQVTHWPVYRSKWQHIGTLHQRFRGCNKQVHANPLPHQDEVYRNMEYFLSYMSKGLESNGPANRK